MKLRDYQEEAVKAVIECWKQARSCLIVLPTGCGKTIVFGEIIRRLISGEVAVDPHRAMVLAHREELITQAEQKIADITLNSVDVEMGPRLATQVFGQWAKTVVSSVQTQITGRINKFAPEDFGVLVIDEAHHATSPSYQNCINHYLKNPNCRLLGVTATPDRADNLALGKVFDAVAYEYRVDTAITDGWLVPVKQKLVEVGSLDYSAVSKCAGDFNQAELAEVLEEEENLHGVAAPSIEICGKRRAIIFAASVRQAERLAEIINRTAPGKAGWLCGKTNKEVRKSILDDFRDGKLQFVVNVGVLTEGFDDAGVEVVVMARPTESRALYAQMAGRATRPAAEIADKLGEVGALGDRALPDSVGADHRAARRALIAKSSKPSCLIIDFVGNSGKHKLITSTDILGGKMLDNDEVEAQKIVRKRCQESPEGLDVQAELEKARAEITERKLNEAKEREFIQLGVDYKVKIIDPFDLYDLAPKPPEKKSLLDQRMLSIKQKNFIRDRLKLAPETMSPATGKALIDTYFRRLTRGLATLKQTKCLREHGVLLPMSFREASATISRIRADPTYRPRVNYKFKKFYR